MAKCCGCSAELPNNSIVCSYCGTRNDVDLKNVHEYTINHHNSERLCPACSIPMQTIDIGDDETFLIERCEECFGLFFDPNELETILENSVRKTFEVNNDLLNQFTLDIRTPGTKIVYRKCPICKDLMNRVNFGARSGVIIDKCRGHGIWLDGGELKRLMEWQKAGGQIEKDQQAKRQRNKKTLTSHNSYNTDSTENILSHDEPTSLTKEILSLGLKALAKLIK